MAKQFLTGLNLNKNELLNARIQNLTTAPSSPVSGQIYYNSTAGTLYYYNGTAWVALAQGGDVESAINNAIANATTDDIDEGSNNLYYTDQRVADYVSGSLDTDDLSEGSNNLYFTDDRAKDAVANAFSGGTQQNITITYNAVSKTFDVTAENGVGDSTTDDLSEGSNNLYFTDSRAREAISSGDNYIVYNNVSGAITLDTSNVATSAYVDQEISDVNNTIDGLTTTDIAEGTNEYFTDARARGAISVGDNSLTYNSVSGVLTANTSTLATVSYVDTAVQTAQSGLDVKLSVRAATTEDIELSGEQTIDGVSVVAGNRVLVKNQDTASENGIYVAAAGAWSRATDAEDGELSAGAFTFVEEGTTYGDTGWVISTNGAITVGTTGITWTQFSGAGVITAGNGLVQNGTTFDVVGTANRIDVAANAVDISNTYAGQSSITTVGTITTGEWQGNAIAVLYGGTGATTAAGARSNLGATTKYAVSNSELEPTSNVVTWTITHNLNTEDVTVQMRDLGTDALVEADVVITSANVVTISWTSAANVAAESYRTVVTG
jgi:hypothetical protein